MHLYDLWREFHENNPDVDSTVVFNPWNLLVKGVEAGEVDAAFVELSEIDGLTHLASRALFDDCSCVVVRRDHPFAEQDVVTTDQLRGQRLLLPDASISPRYFRSFREQLGNAGLEVREMGQGNYFEATLAMAAAGSGVAIMPRSYRMVSDVVRFVDLDAPEIPIHMGLVWRKQNDNPALPAFVDAAAAWDWTM
jgi:DNA-binding transcriptional LysR family regulator